MSHKLPGMDDPKPSETQTLIKRLRERKLSQSEIARRTGIPQPRLSRWESGEVPDAADDALKLAALVASFEAPSGDMAIASA